MGMLSLAFAVSCREAEINGKPVGNADAEDKTIEIQRLKAESLKECQALLTEARKANSGEIAAALSAWDEASLGLQRHKQYIDPPRWLTMQGEVDKARAATKARLASLRKSYLRLVRMQYAPIEGKPIEAGGKVDRERLRLTRRWIDALVQNGRGAEALELALEYRRCWRMVNETPKVKRVDLAGEWNLARCLAAAGKHNDSLKIYIDLILLMDTPVTPDSARRLWLLRLEHCRVLLAAYANDKDAIARLADYIETGLPRQGDDSLGGFKLQFLAVSEKARRLSK